MLNLFTQGEPTLSNLPRLHVFFGSREREFSVEFQLNENPFVEKWLMLLTHELQRGKAILDNGVFYGPTIHSQGELLDVMIHCIATVNTRTSENITLRPKPGIDQDFLNSLHKEFERISAIETYWQGRGYDDVHKALVDLNTAIHQYQSLEKNRLQSGTHNFSADVNFQKGLRLGLVDEDYKYFSTERFYGELYLNYATVGVPVIHAFKNREKDLPVPQRHYKADFGMTFEENTKFTQWTDLKKWITEQYRWDPDDPKLALGYISLGRLVVQNPDAFSRKDFFTQVKSNRRISRIALA